MKKRNLYLTIFLPVLLFSIVSRGQNINTFAGGGTGGDGGTAINASLINPWGVGVDPSGNVYIAQQNHRIRKVNNSGVISTFAGTSVSGYSGDGGSALVANINVPGSFAFDGVGNLYFTDNNNNVIRKINNTGIISTFAGTGAMSYGGDGGPANLAQLNDPCGIVFDSAGNMYIADRQNNRIRKVNTSGIISTYAGTGVAGYSGDGGTSTNAKLNNPCGVALDQSGNLYVTDIANSIIRKINTSGIISTCAGTPSVSGYSGDGGAAVNAKLASPYGIAFDALGNMYISDVDKYCIRKINTSGIISTFVGTGIAGFTGDGGPANIAQINYAIGIAIDQSGNLYIADNSNQRIRIVNLYTGIDQYIMDSVNLSIYPNPSAGMFKFKSEENTKLIVTNMLGESIIIENLSTGFNTINLHNQINGVYFYKLIGSKVYTGKLIKE